MNKKIEIYITLTTFTLAALLFSLTLLLTHTHSPTGFAIAGDTQGPIGNTSYLNCTVQQGSCSGGFTKILGLFNYTNAHAEYHNQSDYSYSLCCAPTVGGVTINTTNTSDSSSFNFINLFQINNSHVEIPNATTIHYANGTNSTHINNDPYTISSYISTSSGSITCSYYENKYGNCTYENETCLITVPMNQTVNTTNLHAASCNQSQFDTSVCCVLSPVAARIYINGTYAPPGTNFSNAGMPINVTVESTLSGGRILAYEYNGYTFSSLPQYSDSNVSTTGLGIIPIKDLFTSFTLIPTGGPTGKETEIGDYSIIIKVQDSSNSTVYTQPFNVSSRSLVSASQSIEIPNRGDVAFNAQNLYSAFSYAQAWLNSGGGTNHQLTINGSSNIIGNTFTVNAAEPTGLHITVLDHNTGSPISGATINITENNGYVMFSLPQYSDSNVSNVAIGTVTTNSQGVTNVTLVQTGGPTGKEDEIGNFTLQLKVYNTTNDLINTVNLTTNRTLSSVSGSPQPIPNQGDVAFNAQNLYSVFSYVQDWLNQ